MHAVKSWLPARHQRLHEIEAQSRSSVMRIGFDWKIIVNRMKHTLDPCISKFVISNVPGIIRSVRLFLLLLKVRLDLLEELAVLQ